MLFGFFYEFLKLAPESGKTQKIGNKFHERLKNIYFYQINFTFKERITYYKINIKVKPNFIYGWHKIKINLKSQRIKFTTLD